MVYGVVQVLPARPVSARSEPSRTSEDDLRTAAFECQWPISPDSLREVILSRIDWGPFDISCRRHPESEDMCLCTVHYTGPLRERPHLMASFWHVMEQFSFYAGRVREQEGRMGYKDRMRVTGSL